jgi:hypothetical protein
MEGSVMKLAFLNAMPSAWRETLAVHQGPVQAKADRFRVAELVGRFGSQVVFQIGDGKNRASDILQQNSCKDAGPLAQRGRETRRHPFAQQR